MKAHPIFDRKHRRYFLFHIPHSAVHIPDTRFFVNEEILEKEILYTTDVFTDKIFQIDSIDKVVCDFSRAFCDVERFVNPEEEEMEAAGRGFYYTKSFDESPLRHEDEAMKAYIRENFYQPYHQHLENKVNEKLEQEGLVKIIDCHSFNEERLPFEKESARPDICLGTTEHTSSQDLSAFRQYFESNGFSVDINTPYSGSYLPQKCRDITKVESIMIEINKRLYMKNDAEVDFLSVIKLNNVMAGCFG